MPLPAVLTTILGHAAAVYARARRIQHASADIFGANPNTPPFTITFGNPVVAGHVGLVIIRGSNATAATINAITDTVGTAYSAIVSDTTQDPYMFLYAGAFPSSGANTVTVQFTNANTNFTWAEVIEVSGIQATADATGHLATTGATDQTGQALTTTAPAYLVMGAALSGTVTYTAGTDSQGHAWTLVDGSIGATPFGGVQEYIANGGATALTPHMTASDGSSAYTTVCAAFRIA